MNSKMLVLLGLITAAAFSAGAADAEKKLTPQQQRMSDCAHESKGLKGDEHKKFMSDCLKGHKTEAPASAPKSAAAVPSAPTQQDKMKSCNAEAGKNNLKGEERKSFMSGCLKGSEGGAKAQPTKSAAADTKSAKAEPTQREKMKTCNAEASGKKLKGDERKTFMSSCLKGS